MGQWHKPWQVAYTIKNLEKDWTIEQLYEFELTKGWTDATQKDNFWNNTKERIFNLTGKHFTWFINKKTKNYRHILKYYLDMSIKHKKDSEKRKILEEANKEDLITMIEILQEEVEELKKEKANKERIKSTYKLIHKISHNSRFSERKLTQYFSINRKTFHNYKNVVGHGNIFRSDFKHNQWYYKNMIITMFNEYNWTQGPFKICGMLNKKGISISVPTVRRILKDSQLYVCTLPKKYIPKELKDTRQKRDYLLTKETIQNSKPGEIFSLDFMYVKTNRGNRYVHAAIDVISQQVVSLVFTNNMTSEVVSQTINHLPKTTKIINTDYGKQYFESNVVNELKQRNITHSCGNVGKSTDNGWIERFWKRLRSECLNVHDSYNASDMYLKTLLSDYRIFWNSKRVISTLNWYTPNEYAILNKNGVN